LVWQLQTTLAFDKQARRFLRQHPELRSKFEEVLTQLTLDPFDPALRLHALAGKLEGMQAARINYKYRVVLVLRIQGKTILLLDVGGHDAVYR
jgi:mRNA-degrading endonuclease YafQ of YafQ-DinJ toxin-antitoxin module